MARAAQSPAPSSVTIERDEARASRSIEIEAGLIGSTAFAGASNTYLRPGKQEPEGTFIVSARPYFGVQGRLLGARLTYAPSLQRYLAGRVTGIMHDLDLGLRFQPVPSLSMQAMAFGSMASYDMTGPVAGVSQDTGSLPLIATRSRAAGLGAGLRFYPDARFGARAAALATFRSSQAIFAGEEELSYVDEAFFEGSAAAVWRPVRRVEVSLGPVTELRFADREHLSYRGIGLSAAMAARAWRSGGVELSVRGQHNIFDEPSTRADVFSRVSLLAWQELGSSFRISARYVYTANGSALAAYDADRHLLIMMLSARSPQWRR